MRRRWLAAALALLASPLLHACPRRSVARFTSTPTLLDPPRLTGRATPGLRRLVLAIEEHPEVRIAEGVRFGVPYSSPLRGAQVFELELVLRRP